MTDKAIIKLGLAASHVSVILWCNCLQLGSLLIQCLFTPCHTSGHICYFVRDKDATDPVVFTGRKWTNMHIHHTHAHTHSHARTHTHTHMRTHTYIRTHTHSRAHTHTHHARTHTHIWPCLLYTSSIAVGDTLFLAGCGKFFEGTADQMYHALINVLKPLPGNTVSLVFIRTNSLIAV
jgi:hypothetical protein